MEKIKAALLAVLAVHDRWHEHVDPNEALRQAQKAYAITVLEHIGSTEAGVPPESIARLADLEVKVEAMSVELAEVRAHPALSPHDGASEADRLAASAQP